MTAEGAATLARIYLQALAISVVFAGAGQWLYRVGFGVAAARAPASLRASFGFFLGITLFYPAWLFLSRLIGARAALIVTLLGMTAIAVREAALALRTAPRPARWSAFGVILLALVALYSLTTLGLWLNDLWPRPDIALLDHFGSVHGGRYANYAVFIAENDRIPWLGQNGGQSMLASVHLLLGVDSPLAAVMVWLPVSLAWLTILFYGLLRAEGFRARDCAVAAFAIMFCNVAVSLVHVSVFDNGSPLGFIGYTDMVVGIGTFLAFAMWIRVRLQQPEASRMHLALPLLLGVSWAWYAPQDIVIALAAAAATAALEWRRGGSSVRSIAQGVLVCAVAAAIGATQFGSLLPRSLREDTGFWEQEVKPELALRPYIQFVRNQWTVPIWNEPEPGLYAGLYATAQPVGRDEVYRVRTWTAEDNFWTAIRVYGFTWLGLAALYVLLRRAAYADAAERERWRIAWEFAAFSFAIGFAFVFLFELGGKKWWLSRFLVPGTAAALVCLAYAVLRGSPSLAPRVRRVTWSVLLAVALVGPLFELVTVSYRNFVERGRADPITERLELLATRHGPFIFESLDHDPPVATEVERGVFKAGGGWFDLGGPSRRPGLALWSPPMSLRAGARRVGFCLLENAPIPTTMPLVEIEVVQGRDRVIARRTFRREDLAAQLRGQWAWLSFDLPHASRDVRFRLYSLGDAYLQVGAMRLERE